MAQNSPSNLFTGKMTKDINPSFIPQGSYVEGRNCRIGFSEESNVGCVENIKGTLEITNSGITDTTGRYQTIGSAPFEAGSLIYYFVCDTIGTNHAIYEFNLLTRVIVLVLKQPNLGFSVNQKISSCFYFNDMLFWVFGKNDINHIFVSLAKSGTYPYNIKETATLIKFPPNRAITGVPMTSATGVSSLLGTTQYQFVYRFVDYGGMYSVWSVASATIGVTSPTDFIRLTLPDTRIGLADLYSGIIKYIEIGFRTDDTQPYTFFERINFPTVRSAAFTVDFYNDLQGSIIANDQTGTGKTSDSVPRGCGAMEFAQGRILTANNTTGFDEVFSILATEFDPSGSFPPVDAGNYFVQGGKYSVGVVLYDAYDRESFVYKIGGFQTQKRNGPFAWTQVSVILTGQLPDWVVSWRPVITKCQNKGSVLQAHITVVGATGTQLEFSATFQAPTPTNYAWVFTTGDKFSLLTSGTGTDGVFARNMWDLPLTTNDAGNFVVLGDFTGVVSGAIVEFYAPIKSATTSFYYEYGQTYPVNVTSRGNFFGGDIGGENSAFVINGGDSFYLTLDHCQRVNLDVTNYQVWFHGIGRDNIVSLDVQKEVTNISNIQASDPYIQGTNINGLNSFQYLSQQTYPVELGAITRLMIATNYGANGSVLLVSTNTNLYSVYLGLTQTFNADGTSNLVASDTLLGTYNLLNGQGGTSDPASMFRWGTNIMGLNALRGIQWRYAQDGVTELSTEHGMNSYLSNLMPSIDVGECVSCFDPYFKEWLIYLKQTDGKGSVLAYNDDKDGYSVYYDMQPDWMCTLNRHVVFWRNGVLYLGREGAINSLLGKQVESSITYSVVPEQMGATVSARNPFKTINAYGIWLYSQDRWSVRVQGIDRTNKPVQTVTMPSTAGVYEEDKYAFQIKKDQLGKDIKSRYLLVKLTLDPAVDKLSVLYGAEAYESASNPNPETVK